MNYLTVIFTLTLTEKSFDGCFLILLIPIQKRNMGSQALSSQPLRYETQAYETQGNLYSRFLLNRALKQSSVIAIITK